MARAKRPAQDRDAIMALVPDGAKRIKVQTEKGERKYKDLADLADSDVIVLNRDGIPVVMMSNPGRKKIPDIAPANDVVAEILKRKKEVIDQDAILTTARSNPDSPDVLHHVIVELGQEVASLVFERMEAERNGKDTTNVSVKRISGLKALADTWLKRKDQLVNREIDMNSPGFRAVMKFAMETWKEAMAASGLRPEMVETVFTKAARMMNDDTWEHEAKARMKNS